jgi:hypothetical protein
LTKFVEWINVIKPFYVFERDTKSSQHVLKGLDVGSFSTLGFIWEKLIESETRETYFGKELIENIGFMI